MEGLLARHRKEQRDLQARITQKKKASTKKTRKGINDECERLQRELAAKHEAEVAQIRADGDGGQGDGGRHESVMHGLEDLRLEEGTDEVAANGEQPGTARTMDTTTAAEDEDDDNDNDNDETLSVAPSSTKSSSSSAATSISSLPSQSQAQPQPTGSRTKKPNRQKARLARRAAEQAAMAEIAAEEAKQQPDHRGNERETMDAVFRRLKLEEVEIQPDGHCLYSAVAKQLDSLGLGLRPDPARIVLQPVTQARIDTVTSPQHDGYRAVRAVTADFILAHKDEFEPFMEEPLEEYTRKIKLTAEWGGQLELQAIARAYGVEINVVQADGRTEKIEPDENTELLGGTDIAKRVLWLAYYRHSYGLGEHYNALVKMASDKASDQAE